jgi:hypothetical protein
MSFMSPLSTPPLPPASDFAAVSSLLALLADPAAFAERHKLLSAATEEARAATAEAHAERASLATEKETHQSKLDAAKAAHSAEIDDKQAHFDTDWAARETAVRRREDNAAERERVLAADQAAVALLRTDVETRLALIRSAAAP